SATHVGLVRRWPRHSAQLVRLNVPPREGARKEGHPFVQYPRDRWPLRAPTHHTPPPRPPPHAPTDNHSRTTPRPCPDALPPSAPDNPQITRPLATRAGILSIASSLNARMVQSPLQPEILRTKLRNSPAPCGVCTTSRWNCVA